MRSADARSTAPSRTRSASAAATAAGLLAAAALLPAAPAAAHGAPTSPLSRTAACAAGGEETGAAACRAARKATGGALGAYDNLRIADVNGRDKQVVPDGKLCSGGLDAYAGLDLARDDWPATSVTAGDTLPVRYAGTIPHKGSFRFYLTKAGYDPEEPLSWADLTGKPIAEVTDPPLRDGAYRMGVPLPEGRSGRHVLYTVWETSSTPDTYYSCSDLLIKPLEKTPAVVKRSASPTPSRSEKAPAPSTSVEAPATPATAGAAAPAITTAPPRLDPVASAKEDRVHLGHLIIGGALAVIVVTLIGALLSRRRAREN